MHFEDFIIGSGQAGVPLATRLAGKGRRVAIAEKGPLGGSCINEGCTPTKTMLASARIAYLARRAADYGVLTGEVTVGLPAVRKRKRDIVDSVERRQPQRDGASRNTRVDHGRGAFYRPA